MAVRTLAEQEAAVIRNIVPDDATQTINAYVAEIDRKLSGAEVEPCIMQHEEF